MALQYQPQMHIDDADKKRDLINDLTERILGAVFEVQNSIGCGFLERIYEGL